MRAKIGYGLQPGELGCNIHQQELRLQTDHVGMGQSTHQHLQDLGLGISLMGELWRLPY